MCKEWKKVAEPYLQETRHKQLFQSVGKYFIDTHKILHDNLTFSQEIFYPFSPKATSLTKEWRVIMCNEECATITVRYKLYMPPFSVEAAHSVDNDEVKHSEDYLILWHHRINKATVINETNGYNFLTPQQVLGLLFLDVPEPSGHFELPDTKYNHPVSVPPRGVAPMFMRKLDTFRFRHGIEVCFYDPNFCEIGTYFKYLVICISMGIYIVVFTFGEENSSICFRCRWNHLRKDIRLQNILWDGLDGTSPTYTISKVIDHLFLSPPRIII